MTHKVFLSHSSKDKNVAETICRALEARGIECWLALRDVRPGENFMAAIVQAIRGAKAMVLIFTSHANESEEVKKELVLASQQRLVIIPVRTEDVLPDDALSYQFATAQWVDLFNDWEGQLERLSLRLDGLLPKETPTSAEPKSVSQTTYRSAIAPLARISQRLMRIRFDRAKPPLPAVAAADVPRSAPTATPPASPTLPQGASSARLLHYARLHPIGTILALVAVIVIANLPFTLKTVPTGHAGVLWKRFRGPDFHCWCFLPSGNVLAPDEIRNEGLTVIWPWDKLFIYDLRLQAANEKYNAVTSDGSSMVVEVNMRYQLNHDSIAVFNEFIGSDYLNRVLTPDVRNQARNVISQYTVQELNITKREEIEGRIRDQTAKVINETLGQVFQSTASKQRNAEQFRGLILTSIHIVDTRIVNVATIATGTK
jgi:hypothetical protein